MTRRVLQVAAAIVLFAFLAWGGTRLLESLMEPSPAPAAT